MEVHACLNYGNTLFLSWKQLVFIAVSYSITLNHNSDLSLGSPL